MRNLGQVEDMLIQIADTHTLSLLGGHIVIWFKLSMLPPRLFL
jgi:hypothetical protein